MDIRKIKKLIEMLQASDLREIEVKEGEESVRICLLYTSPSPRDPKTSRMPSSA